MTAIQTFLASKGYNPETYIHLAELISEYAAKLEEHKDCTVGLWATDQVEAIPEDKKELFFQIEFK